MFNPFANWFTWFTWNAKHVLGDDGSPSTWKTSGPYGSMWRGGIEG